MIQLKLKLNSNKPSYVYALNGKSYRLEPGSNILNLEYDDYVSLAKALSIKPVQKPTENNVENKLVNNEDKHEDKKEEIKEAPVPQQEPEEPAKEELPTEEPKQEESVEEPTSEVPAEEQEEVKEEKLEVIDYSTWSFTKLKAEYKSITGNPCKMKKDDVIAFLQEHSNNAR